MDEVFWESFEPIFAGWTDGQFSMGVGLEKVKSKIEASGYRCIESGGGHKFEKKSAHDLWEKIQEAMKEGGSVIYCRTNLEDSEFVWIQEIEDPIQLSFEMQTTKYYDGEYDDTETIVFTIQRDDNAEFDHIPTIEHEDTVINNVGLDNRSNMEDVDGEHTWVSKIMFNRYHSNYQKMWFTDSVIIPQPYNMRWPEWVMKALRAGMIAKMTALHP